MAQEMADYYNAKETDTLNTFQFQPQPMSFEVIDKKTFAEVLYPKYIYDIIDYFVRECVKREQPIRICKSCGWYFAISGRINTEYADRPIDDKGRTCKDLGAINVWTEKRKDDEVFNVYQNGNNNCGQNKDCPDVLKYKKSAKEKENVTQYKNM